MPSRPAFLIAAAAAGLVAIVAVVYWQSAARAGLLRPYDTAVVAEGRAVYEAHCASCHGRKLEGQPNWKTPRADGKLPAPPHDQTGHTWHHPDRQLFELTKFGLAKVLGEDYATDMPVYDGVLTDREIVAVLSYIKSTWPESIRRRHDRMNARAAEDGG